MKSVNSSFFIVDKINQKHEIFNLSPANFEELRSQKDVVFCTDIFDKYSISAYKLVDGKVVVAESSSYALYPSIEVLSDILDHYNGPQSRQVLDGVNTYGKDFPEVSDSLISKMLDQLHVKTNESNVAVKLKSLDSIILQNRRKDFFDKYYLSFIALIGQHIIDEFGGEWKMVLSEDNKTWNPLIKISGQEISIAEYIFEDIHDPNLKTPLTEAFESIRDIIRMNILPLNNVK